MVQQFWLAEQVKVHCVDHTFPHFQVCIDYDSHDIDVFSMDTRCLTMVMDDSKKIVARIENSTPCKLLQS